LRNKDYPLFGICHPFGEGRHHVMALTNSQEIDTLLATFVGYLLVETNKKWEKD